MALAWSCAVTTWAHGDSLPVEGRFRGCEPTGWCHFWFALPGDHQPSLHRVLPDGITPRQRDDALRDRLNELLSDMIHQHKRIELHNLRIGAEGGLTAAITVTGIPLTSDIALREWLSHRPAPETSGASPPR